ncbi:MAG: outer membrane protein transport protein [Gammaproteobacteria bacterium]|nr:outer membrane protein transport protein [Gammaproteobacteria bacterium]
MMTVKKIWMSKKIPGFFFPVLMLLSFSAHASFIETTVGTAVVNDATASYYNPAALMLVKNPQIIPQVTAAYFHTRFTGQSTPVSTGITQNGSSSSNTNYYSPSFYFGIPVTGKIILGLAVVSNSANRDISDNSILRYVQSSNDIQDYDVVPAIAIKINDVFSIGAGINFSYSNFDLKPILGFPGTDIADAQSHNQSDGSGVGGNIGFLYKPSPATLIGFNYRSMTTYNLSGKSVYEGSPQVVSNNYHFKLSTPARSIFSINHFVSPKLGFIFTAQRTQWSSLTNIHVYNVANVSGTTPVIVNGTIPYYLRDTWQFTFGSHYRITPKWVLRVAGSYNQSPANPHYQVANGDSIVLGASMAYEINKIVTIDGSYAHAFMKDENININGARYLVQGVNEGSRDAVSLKLTFNV